MTFQSSSTVKTSVLDLDQDMESHNVNGIKALGSPIAPVKADCCGRDARGDRGENESGLPTKLLLAKGAKFRLVANLWTDAGLVNGATGFILAIIYEEGQGPPALPRAIIATFEDYMGPAFFPNVDKSVPITPIKRAWTAAGKTVSRRQLPIILGYALREDSHTLVYHNSSK